MAIVKQGFLGKLSGKLGNSVFLSYKGLQTIRSKQQPYKSNTTKQEQQRNDFGLISSLAALVSKDFYEKFWKYYSLKQTPRNNFLHEVYKIGFPAVEPQYFFFSRGKLEQLYPWTYSRYDITSGKLALKSNFFIYGNGQADDRIYLLVFYSDPYPVIFYEYDNKQRGQPFFNVFLPAGLDPAHLGIYWCCYRGNGRNILTSNSVYQNVIAL